MIDPARALPGRSTEMPVAARHAVLGTPMQPPFPEGFQQLVIGMGCFWGAERVFWQAPGVYTTAVGYAGGTTPNPTYEEVCSGSTGHTEAVLVVWDPAQTSLEEILRLFWENHDPTQGMRQGNDVGTQYRSAIYVADEAQRAAVEASREMYNARLTAAGYPEITTEIADAGPFYYAEDYHQQYLHKNPWGYCGLGGTGVSCPVGVGARAPARRRRGCSPGVHAPPSRRMTRARPARRAGCRAGRQPARACAATLDWGAAPQTRDLKTESMSLDLPLTLTNVCDEYAPVVERDGDDPALVSHDFAAFARAHGLDASVTETDRRPVTLVRCRRGSFTLDWRCSPGRRAAPRVRAVCS